VLLAIVLSLPQLWVICLFFADEILSNISTRGKASYTNDVSLYAREGCTYAQQVNWTYVGLSMVVLQGLSYHIPGPLSIAVVFVPS
jgi:hypothetical protein